MYTPCTSVWINIAVGWHGSSCQFHNLSSVFSLNCAVHACSEGETETEVPIRPGERPTEGAGIPTVGASGTQLNNNNNSSLEPVPTGLDLELLPREPQEGFSSSHSHTGTDAMVTGIEMNSGTQT